MRAPRPVVEINPEAEAIAGDNSSFHAPFPLRLERHCPVLGNRSIYSDAATPTFERAAEDRPAVADARFR